MIVALSKVVPTTVVVIVVSGTRLAIQTCTPGGIRGTKDATQGHQRGQRTKHHPGASEAARSRENKHCVNLELRDSRQQAGKVVACYLLLLSCQDGKVPDLSVGNSSCNNIADSQIPVLCDIDYGSCGKTNQLKAALAVVLLFQRSLTKRPFTPIAH